ncbi:MAG: ectoine hydroxylase-related dioxygenase (phytanoyl-CoA dioxygenase family) [Candidatus Poriferisodalaceae bacterium]|jgi:ectoine hydroxylase-related dioxygenase (phytanoyl-CoA dioxygenase family)
MESCCSQACSIRNGSRCFFFDAVFVRSPGSQFSTPWHQDEPYWSADGHNTCSIWMPLVPVVAANALSFVPGSHRGTAALEQPNFGDLNPDRVDWADQSDFSVVAEDAPPDIDSDHESWGVVSWDMVPGDCIAFNSRIKLSSAKRRALRRRLRLGRLG